MLPTMNWMLGDIGKKEGVAEEKGLARGDGGGGGFGFADALNLSRPTSSRTRSTDKFIDSRPMLVSRLWGSIPR